MCKTMLTLSVCAWALMAQTPPPPPPAGAIQAYLTLTDTQVSQLQQQRREQAQAIQPVVQQIREKEKALRDLLETGTTDAAATGRAVLELHALRKQVGEIDGRYHAQALQLLTAAQKTKLAALADAAKLQPAIHQAVGLNLLDPPEGLGPRPGGAPGGPAPLFPPGRSE